MGPKEPTSGTLAPLQYTRERARIDARLPAVELDRTGYLGLYAARTLSHRAALLRREAASRDAGRSDPYGGRRADEASSRRGAANPRGALPDAWLLPADWRRRVRRRHFGGDRGGDDGGAHFRARRPPNRPRSIRLHGAQEARGLFLMN